MKYCLNALFDKQRCIATTFHYKPKPFTTHPLESTNLSNKKKLIQIVQGEDMVSLQFSSAVITSVAYSSSRCRRGMIRATINMPKLQPIRLSLNLLARELVLQEVLDMGVGLIAATLQIDK
ncbi:hypothetical protein CK203_068621 [Vitis vinifera]|uniref:Uncharacterized protein n=1 Tax=Vitis vinifera TaxID=29760 RepID=A0A438EDT9_VITVI|nr:hypothetical protein CK203_068621 [Vitis vinifera]